MEAYCVLFAGQSVQEGGMCEGLWRNKAARGILDRLKPSLGDDLEHATTLMPDAELRLTVNCQRAIHASHLGHWFAYRALNPGLRLDGAIGHSMGVVAALVAVGALTVEDSGAFIRARAESFGEACRAAGGTTLAAVSSPSLEGLEGRLKAFPGLELALHNTLRRATVGGPPEELRAFEAASREQGWPYRIALLNVEGAYHTRAFSRCREALARTLEGLKVAEPEAPVFMGTSGRAETDPARIRRLLVEQADSRERHLEAVRAAYAGGCRNFLEVARRPQPIEWLGDQLKAPDGTPLPGYRALPVTTGELCETVQ